MTVTCDSNIQAASTGSTEVPFIFVGLLLSYFMLKVSINFYYPLFSVAPEEVVFLGS